MSDACNVCGRPLDSTPGNTSDVVCWRECLPPKDGDYWNERDARECYRLGYTRELAAREAAERENTRLISAVRAAVEPVRREALSLHAARMAVAARYAQPMGARLLDVAAALEAAAAGVSPASDNTAKPEPTP